MADNNPQAILIHYPSQDKTRTQTQYISAKTCSMSGHKETLNLLKFRRKYPSRSKRTNRSNRQQSRWSQILARRWV